MIYRAELDGLRAIAVLSVLFFHAGFPWASGGFVGVDVFFVLSGFFITHILLSEHDKKTFSTISFYERRARRLLPAFFFILVCTIILNILTLTPDKFSYFSQSIIPAVGIYANVFFTNTSNYFSPSAETFPLLHIWSLSVEEQFYVLFPVALTICFAIRKFTKILVPLMFVAGIMLSYYLMLLSHEKGYHMWSFFMMPARAWELLAGGAVAWLMKTTNNPSKRLTKEIGSTLGLSLILFSILWLDSDMVWPHHITLLPIIGTALLIYYCSTDTTIGKLLSMRFVVFIGVISYSLYLWHQPLFALYRNIHIGKPSLWAMSGLILLATLLAWATYIWVESPFRNKQTFSRKQIFSLSGTTIIIMLSIGWGLSSLGEWNSRYTSVEAKAFELPSRKDRSCVTMPSNEVPVGDTQCRRNKGADLKAAVIGDSHSNQISLALEELFPTLGFQQYTRSACGPAIYFDSAKSPNCQSWVSQAVKEISETDSIKSVFIIYRHSYYVKGEQFHLHEKNILTVNEESISNSEAQSRYLASIRSMVQTFNKLGKKVYLFAPIPELPDDISKMMMPPTIFGEFDRLENNKASSIYSYSSRHQWIMPLLSELDRDNENIKVFYPASILCENKHCPYLLNGEPMYYDDDHITKKVAKKLLSF